jgi:hypothetical protein
MTPIAEEAPWRLARRYLTHVSGEPRCVWCGALPEAKLLEHAKDCRARQVELKRRIRQSLSYR